jgi:hypothetical protein
MRRLLFAASLLLLPLATDASFVDVPDWHPYKYAIDEAQVRGIITGYADGTFRPGNALNRAEFTTMVVRALYDENAVWAGCDDQSRINGVAPDVVRDSWYEMPVCFAKNKGIIEGYPDGTFKPEQTINVVEASAIVARAFNLQYEKTGAWYEGPMKALGNRGALPISMDSVASPVKRFELAAMLYPLLTGEATPQLSFTYEDFTGLGPDTARYPLVQQHIRAAYDQQVQAGTLRDYSDAHFDGCGAVSSYADQPWYADLKAKIDRNPTAFWDKELSSEGCYASDARVFVFLGPTDYCMSGNIYRYDIQSGELLQASMNMHNDDSCQSGMHEFGKRVGTVIPVTGSIGDAGCSAETFYDYDFARNHVELKKVHSWCQGDEEGTWTYF